MTTRDTSKDAPKAGCGCAVCWWLRENADLGPNRPIRPHTDAWDVLMRASGAGRQVTR